MGYEGVEFAGYYDRTAEELRDMCDDLGLKVAGTHTGLNTLLGDELAKTVAFNKGLGNPYLIVPGLSEEHRNSQQAWLDTAKLFNDIAEKIADQGMCTGYHNHTSEFEPMEGKLPWDTFGGNTRDDVVMQIDIGHALRAGADPVSFIERYPGRSKLVHLKEYSSTDDRANVGEDHRQTSKECYRVLKPGGKAIFMENMRYHPMVWLYRKMFLKYSGKLRYFSVRNIETVGAEFEKLEHREFYLSAVSALFWQKCISIPLFYRWSLGILKAIDTSLLKCLPFLKRFCWITAMICHKD
ncbi:hypothetical protein GBAR_LOCUS1672 [Geodia barretti]|uniref:Xylose isomerase-like TIM barrel domain-containing protein n=1 Tax=Geodia barretti TaxID=519541 RepID=A0AA35QWX6_GEOBA|nr:hypothetical protein GBAR_LOCUS1672 [Geodia barretti]